MSKSSLDKGQGPLKKETLRALTLALRPSELNNPLASGALLEGLDPAEVVMICGELVG